MIRRRARWILALIPLMLVTLLLWTAWARGWLEQHEVFELVAADVKGLSNRTPVTFAGLPVGEVAGMAVRDDGQVDIQVRVRGEYARWVTGEAVFVLERSLLGAASIRLVPGPDAGAPPSGQRFALQGAGAEIDLAQMADRVNRILTGVEDVLAPDADFRMALQSTRLLAERASGPHGILHAVTGREDSSRQVFDLLNEVLQTNQQAAQTLERVDTLLQRVDAHVNDDGGLLLEAAQATRQLQDVLGRSAMLVESLSPVVANMQQMGEQGVAILQDVQGASTDLDQLRGELESRLRELQDMNQALQRRWPFATDPSIRLP